jgi:Holliday junction resolvasome RuvABC ATP-dependent DNA helicase subunit
VIDAILDIEKKKKRMENDTKVLNKSAEEYVGKTENKRKFTLIAKSKSMRRSANDTPKTLETFEKEV